ncbi:MAG: hypothetical protein GXZ08_04845 [Tissierellia bacterium]|nr:hypothetical protein [Tissierellia bacterium]
MKENICISFRSLCPFAFVSFLADSIYYTMNIYKYVDELNRNIVIKVYIRLQTNTVY